MTEPAHRDADAQVAGAGTPPSRGLAVALSLSVPGLGHAYLGLWRRAALWVAAPIALLGLLCAGMVLVPLRGAFGLFVPTLILVMGSAWCASAADAWRAPPSLLRKQALWKLLLFWLGSGAFSLTVASAIRVSLLQAFKTPSGSMQPSLMVRDHVFVNMRAFREPPRRGQLAVFASPEQTGQDFVKRVIGLPGDRLSVSGGHPTINGWPVPRCRVGQARLPDSAADDGAPSDVELEFLGGQAFLVVTQDRGEASAEGPWTVPPGEVFVLGDNRNNSSDSRVWFSGQGGGVPFANLRGQPLFVWLAFNADGSVNWSRNGLALDEPALGNWAPELAAGLRDCLSKQPSRASTEPPAAAR